MNSFEQTQNYFDGKYARVVNIVRAWDFAKDLLHFDGNTDIIYINLNEPKANLTFAVIVAHYVQHTRLSIIGSVIGINQRTLMMNIENVFTAAIELIDNIQNFEEQNDVEEKN